MSYCVISIIVLALGPARELFYAVIPGVIYCVVFGERDPNLAPGYSSWLFLIQYGECDPHRPELRAKKKP